MNRSNVQRDGIHSNELSSARYVHFVDKVERSTTFILMNGNGQPAGRFDVARQSHGPIETLFIRNGRDFQSVLFKFGVPGETMVEMIRPDGTSFSYLFRG